MIMREAAANAQMHLASVANDARLHAAVRLATAHDAVALLAHVLREVLVGQCMNRMQSCSTLTRCVLGRQLLQQLVHEVLAEVELAGAMLRARSGLESEGKRKDGRRRACGQTRRGACCDEGGSSAGCRAPLRRGEGEREVPARLSRARCRNTTARAQSSQPWQRPLQQQRVCAGCRSAASWLCISDRCYAGVSRHCCGESSTGLRLDAVAQQREQLWRRSRCQQQPWLPA